MADVDSNPRPSGFALRSNTLFNWHFLLKSKWNKISVNSCADKYVSLFHLCFSVRICETSCFTYAFDEAVSRDSIVDDDWLRATDWCKRYPYDTIMLCSYGLHEKDVGELPVASGTVRTAQGKERLWVNLTVKMKTRHHVEKLFGSEFRAICNHCGIMAAWSRKISKCCKQFLRFFSEKNPYGKILKIMFRKFT